MNTTDLFEDEPQRCPECFDSAIVPILYGEASTEMETAARLGQIVLSETPGTADSPQWKCQKPRCAYEF